MIVSFSLQELYGAAYSVVQELLNTERTYV